MKDVVLLVGLIRFRINRDVKKDFSSLYGGFLPFLKLAILWTFVEIINPDQKSLVLGLWGFEPIGSGGSRRWSSPACSSIPSCGERWSCCRPASP